MPDVSEIITRLRSWGPVECPWTFENVAVVRLADAEAAVLAAVDARSAGIVKLLGDSAVVAANTMHDGYVPGYRAAADLIARRFPNGGTNDGT